jgi:hypothetical protein
VRATSATSGAALFAALAAGLPACAVPLRTYQPTRPHAVTARGVEIEIASVAALEQTVRVTVRYDAPDGVLLAAPRLVGAASAACAAGVRARDYAVTRDAPTAAMRDRGSIVADFSRADLARDGVLEGSPTDLAVEVVGPDPGCVRVPVVAGAQGVEWRDDALGSVGFDLRLVVPLSEDIAKMGAAFLLAARGGPYVGPLHLRGELFFGSGFGGPQTPHNAYNNFGIGGGALAADGFVVRGDGFALGVQAGVEALAIGFDPAAGVPFPERTYVLKGPRGGLRFVWMGPQLDGRAFHARPEAFTTSIELFGSAWRGPSDVGWVPVLGVAVGMDFGW